LIIRLYNNVYLYIM